MIVVTSSENIQNENKPSAKPPKITPSNESHQSKSITNYNFTSDPPSKSPKPPAPSSFRSHNAPVHATSPPNSPHTQYEPHYPPALAVSIHFLILYSTLYCSHSSQENMEKRTDLLCASLGSGIEFGFGRGWVLGGLVLSRRRMNQGKMRRRKDGKKQKTGFNERVVDDFEHFKLRASDKPS